MRNFTNKQIDRIMKRYISPEIKVVEIDVEELIADSPQLTSRVFSIGGAAEDVSDDGASPVGMVKSHSAWDDEW